MAVLSFGLLFLLIAGFIILFMLAVLLKHGYGKSLAIVFGGMLSLFLLLIVMARIGTPSTERSAATHVTTPHSLEIKLTKTPNVEVKTPTGPVFVEPVIDLPKMPLQAKPVEVNDTAAEKTNEDAEEVEKIEKVAKANPSEDKQVDNSLKDWMASKSNEDVKTFTAEPYLGKAIDQAGNPSEIVKIDLMNQLTDWLAEEVVGLEVNETKQKDQTIKCLWNTDQNELWKRFVTDHHVSKHSTSVGDTETLSIRIADADENIAWLRSLVESRQTEKAYNEQLSLYALGGGGSFLGLVTLYGLLSVGSKESKPTKV